MKEVVKCINKKCHKVCVETEIVGFTYDYNPNIMAVLINKNELLSSDYDFVFYNNRRDNNNSIQLLDDLYKNWYDYRISIDFDKVDRDVKRIIIFISIYDPYPCRAHFGKCDYISYRIFDSRRIYDKNRNEKALILQKNVVRDLTGATIIELGCFVRNENDWDYVLTEKALDIELVEYIKKYGIN